MCQSQYTGIFKHGDIYSILLIMKLFANEASLLLRIKIIANEDCILLYMKIFTKLAYKNHFQVKGLELWVLMRPGKT